MFGLLSNPMGAVPAVQNIGSGAIWHDIPHDLGENPNSGFIIGDFGITIPKHASTSGGAVTAALGAYHCYLDQGGFIRRPTTGLMMAGVELGSDGDNELVTMRHGYTRAFLSSATSTGKAWWEGCFKVSAISTTSPGVFIGLADDNLSATNILLDDSDALADNNLIGFKKTEAAATLTFVYKADGQTAQVPISNAGSMVADTYKRVGFKLDNTNPAAKRITVYVDGVELTTYVTKTNMDAVTFPRDVNLGFAMSSNNATGATPGFSTLQWWALAQSAN